MTKPCWVGIEFTPSCDRLRTACMCLDGLEYITKQEKGQSHHRGTECTCTLWEGGKWKSAEMSHRYTILICWYLHMHLSLGRWATDPDAADSAHRLDSYCTRVDPHSIVNFHGRCRWAQESPVEKKLQSNLLAMPWDGRHVVPSTLNSPNVNDHAQLH